MKKKTKTRTQKISRDAERRKNDKEKGLLNFWTGIFIFLVLHTICGIDYIRGKNAKWVTMNIDSVSISQRRSAKYFLHMSYQYNTFTESVGKRTYEHYKSLHEIQVLNIPGTKWIAFDEGQKWREWVGAMWLTSGFIIFQLIISKNTRTQIRKLSKIRLNTSSA